MTAEPVAATMGLFLVRATVLLLLGWAAASLLRRRAAERRLVWQITFFALLALPMLSALLPAIPLPMLHPHLETMSVSGLPQSAIRARGVVVPGNASLTPALAYAAVSALLVLRLLTAAFVLHRLWSHSTPAPAEHARRLASLARELGMRRPVELRISAVEAMPLTFGTRPARILLPAEALRWEPSRLRMVLLHELSHAARQDALLRTVSAIVCALYWVHPGVWLAARRLAREQEHAADDVVIRHCQATSRDYARCLLDIAAAYRAPSLRDPVLSLGAVSQIEARLRSIVSEGDRRAAGWLTGGVAGFALFGGTALLAAAHPVERASPPPSPLRPVRTIAQHGPKPIAESVLAPTEPPHAVVSSARQRTSTGSTAGLPAASAIPPSVGPSDAEAGSDYPAQLGRYNAQLATYSAQLADYDRQVRDWGRAVDAVRGAGNLADYDNRGSSANSGRADSLRDSRHAPVPPVPPTAPTPPDRPPPVRPVKAVVPVSQAP